MISDIQQINYRHPTLRNLLLWLESETGLVFTITSPYRIGDTGVHGTLPLRGTDLRMRHKLIGVSIKTFINKHWKYDPSRPTKECCVLHGEGANLHLHIQVHPNTEYVQ